MGLVTVATLGAITQPATKRKRASKRPNGAIGKSRSKKKNREDSLYVLRGELTRTVNALTKAKQRADRWRKEAKKQEKSASRARAQVEKLHRKLARASAAPERAQTVAPMDLTSWRRPLEEPTSIDSVKRPDATWSVVQLRAEARARGLTGMSNKTKSELLAALS